MPILRRFLSRRWLLAFLGGAALLIGLAMAHPYPRQSLFGPKINGVPWCVWEDAIRRHVHRAEYEKTLWAKAMLWMGVEPTNIEQRGELYTAEMFPLLLELAEDSDVEIRRLALSARSWTDQFDKDASAQPVYRRRLDDVDPYCRIYAARAIYLFDPNQPVEKVLFDELHGSDIKVRLTAIDALVVVGRKHPEYLPHLAKYATDQNAEVRALVMWALQSYGKEALPILRMALEDNVYEVRRNAAATLGLFGPSAKEAIPALLRCLEGDDWYVHEYARESLFAIDPEQFAEFNPKRNVE